MEKQMPNTINDRIEESKGGHLPALLAKAFIARAEALNLKGVKRDTAALEFFVGAFEAFVIAGDQSKADWTAKLCFLVSIRGYSEMANLAESQPAKGAA